MSVVRYNKSELEHIQGRYFHVILIGQQIKRVKYIVHTIFINLIWLSLPLSNNIYQFLFLCLTIFQI